jgi:predicted RNA-binding Zn ribbon-like protein
MQPLFIGSHPAMDFLNTLYSPDDTVVETIGDGRRLLDWLVAAGLLDVAAASRCRKNLDVEALDKLAHDARKLRKWTTEWVARWSEQPNADYSTEFRRLNALMEHAANYRQVVPDRSGTQLVERSRFESADQLLALIAAEVGALIANEAADLVKQCEGATCTLWFLDRTKAHSRRFCSAAACGNRAKVAAFRQRNKDH